MRSAEDAPRWRCLHATTVDVRTITVGHVHAEPGDPAKVAAMTAWLLANPDRDLPYLKVHEKPNGTFRIYDGRHRFVAYVLAERERVPVEIGELTHPMTGGVL